MQLQPLSKGSLLDATEREMFGHQGSPMQVQEEMPMQAQPQQHQRRGTTPVLQQSTMQLSLGMGLGLTLDLGSWCYGTSSEGGGQAGAPGGVQGAGGTPRASAATHRRRAGAPVEEYPSDQVTMPPSLSAKPLSCLMYCSTSRCSGRHRCPDSEHSSALHYGKHHSAFLKHLQCCSQAG